MSTKPTSAIWQPGHRLAANSRAKFALIEGAGTTITNSVPSMSNGSLLGSPSWIDGDAGKAVQFVSTSSQYANLGALLEPVDMSAGFTLAMKIKTPNPVTGWSLTFLGGVNAGSAIQVYGGTNLLCYINSSYRFWNTWAANTWYTVVVIHPASAVGNANKLSCYRNGTLMSNGFTSAADGYTQGTGNGRAAGAVGVGFSNLIIEDIHIAWRAWDADDVASYNEDPWGVVRYVPPPYRQVIVQKPAKYPLTKTQQKVFATLNGGGLF